MPPNAGRAFASDKQRFQLGEEFLVTVPLTQPIGMLSDGDRAALREGARPRDPVVVAYPLVNRDRF